MTPFIKDDDLVGLRFKKNHNFVFCLELLEKEKPDIYFSLPGCQSIIIQKTECAYFEDIFKTKNIDYEIAEVISAGDIDPEEINELRSEYINNCKVNIDRELQKERIKELKEKLRKSLT